MAISRREERRTLQHDLGRTQLLDAAEEVFGRRGYHGTTLKEIAELAEFSVGSVYSFFENKDDLFLHVFLRRGSALLEGMRAAVGAGGAPLEQLRRLVDVEVGFFRAHPAFARLYLRTSTAGSMLPGRTDAEYLGGLDEAMGLHAAVFAEGQRRGELRAGDPAALARLLSGIVRAFLAADQPDAVAGATAFTLEELQDIVAAAFGTE